MKSEREYLSGSGAGGVLGDDDLMFLDARATLAAALARAVVGYSDRRVRALGWLALATPRLYRVVSQILEQHAIRQSPGASRSLREAIKALSLEEYMRTRDRGPARSDR